MLYRKKEKVYSYQLEKEFKELHGIREVDYRTEKFLERLCNNGIYRDTTIKHKPKYRFTFPFYFLCLLLLILGMSIRWLFTGESYFQEKSWVVRTMDKWRVVCRFNLG